jgi:hypothetical protein
LKFFGERALSTDYDSLRSSVEEFGYKIMPEYFTADFFASWRLCVNTGASNLQVLFSSKDAKTQRQIEFTKPDFRQLPREP